MEFSAHGVRRLLGKSADLLVTQLLVSHKQQQQAVLGRQTIQRFLDALAQLLDFQDAERGVGFGGRVFEKGFVGIREHVPLVPGLLEVAAMINGNAVKPRAPGGFPSELIHLPERLEEDVVGGVLGLLGIAEQPEREVIDRAAMFLIEFGKLGRCQPARRVIHTLRLCQRLAHG